MSAAEERAAFWQETKHRMTRRLAGWDYCQRAIYMITVTLEGRRGEAVEGLHRQEWRVTELHRQEWRVTEHPVL